MVDGRAGWLWPLTHQSHWKNTVVPQPSEKRMEDATVGARCRVCSICIGRTRQGVIKVEHACAERLDAQGVCGWGRAPPIPPSHAPLMHVTPAGGEKKKSRVHNGTREMLYPAGPFQHLLLWTLGSTDPHWETSNWNPRILLGSWLCSSFTADLSQVTPLIWTLSFSLVTWTKSFLRVTKALLWKVFDDWSILSIFCENWSTAL